MLISHEWLRAFVPHDLAPEAVRDLLSAHVATVDRMERLRGDLANIVIARVERAARHPNSDHLWVTKVDDGSGALLDVVCGAPNVVTGAYYPFARVGVTLPGGLKLEKRKIRGEVSNGMLCSARELGLGDEHEGILELNVQVPPGTPFLQAMPVGDVRYDVDVLPNRPDLLSHIGMAREMSALTGVALRLPPELNADSGAISAPIRDARRVSSGGVEVVLEDPEGCPRYMGIVIRGIAVAASPEWLVRRLEAVGLRSINNVVDVTNYFTWGFGQPMHAFDLARLTGSRVVVRRAGAGERMTTLDGTDRALDPTMTVIADAERAVAVAGVMGGRNSEVAEETRDIFLEVAYFTPRNVRAARLALGMSTDASYRFERGIDPAGTPEMVARAAALLMSVAGGRVDGAPMDVGSEPIEPVAITLRHERVRRLLGDRVEPDEIVRLLRGVGFAVAPGPEGSVLVRAPSWRNDVAVEADLVEEIARLRGYDVLPNDVQPFRPSAVPDHPLYAIGRRVRDALVGDGLFEMRPMPFVRGSDDTHARVKNPLAEDEPHLRRSMLETLARRAEYNLSRMQGNVRLFEVGSVFEPRGSGLPREEIRVGALIMGQRRPIHFTEPHPPAFDMWDAKALGERLSSVVYGSGRVAFTAGRGDVLWTLTLGDGAQVGEVRSVALDAPPWASEAFGVELTLAEMPNAPLATPGSHVRGEQPERTPQPARPFTPLPSTPSAEFDLALLLPEGTLAADVERVIRASAGDLLERLFLFDEYRGEGLPAGYRSVAWTLTFRDPTRTLREKEIEGRRQKILRSLETELGVRPRIA